MMAGTAAPAYAGRFAPLVAFLAAQPGDDVALTFEAIEAIIGEGLTLADRISTDHWSGRHRAHARAWGALGWRARLDHPHRVVHFTRAAVPTGEEGDR